MGDGTREAGMRYWVMVGGAGLHAMVEPMPVEYCPKVQAMHDVVPEPVPYVPGWHWAQAVATELEV